MYQKEIIYMGLYRDENRMGSAGFLKLENRERESRLHLKIQNVPLGISGRFPIRIYDGNGWKEINGISIQDGRGSWEEKFDGNMEQTILQVILPGGYALRGRSRTASETGKRPEAQAHEAEPERSPEREPEGGRRDVMEREEAVVPPRSGQRPAEQVRAMEPERSPERELEGGQRDVPEPEEAVAPQNSVQRPAEQVRAVEPERSPEREPEGGWRDVPERSPERELEAGRRDVPEPEEAVVPPRSGQRSAEQVRPVERQRAPQTIIITEELPRRALEDSGPAAQKLPGCQLKEDKWEQILDTYEQIHPYGDGRTYVKIEPKDFVILRAHYQHLVNNSFLLHGFYNYRYIVLGKEQDCYYLGVPGVFYEREKMVALMFGFEAFECPGGKVGAGEFGYYLRKVEL